MFVDVVEPAPGAIGDLAAYEQLKHSLIGDLRGRVLEIGAGCGANFAMLPADVDWVGLEPRRSRRRRLGTDKMVVNGFAEAIPLQNAGVDAVLSTIVLCSVRDQEQALAEVRRVLRAGGRFVFFEHVAAPRGTWRNLGQRLVAPCNRIVDAGCDPSRETWRAIESAGFHDLDLRWFTDGRRRYIGGYGVA